MDCLRDLMATLTNQTLLVMVGSYPRHKIATIPRQNPCATDHTPMPLSPKHHRVGVAVYFTGMETRCIGCMLQLYILHASSRLARHAIQHIQRIQLYSYTRYTAYSTIQPPSGYQRRRRNMSEPSKGGCMASAVHELWMGTFTIRDGGGSSGANAQRGTCAASPGPLGKGRCDMVV